MASSDIRLKAAIALAPFHTRGIAPVALTFKVDAQASNRLDFVFPPVKPSKAELIRIPQTEIPARSFVLPKAGEYSQIPLLAAEVSELPDIQMISAADANDFALLKATSKVFRAVSSPPTLPKDSTVSEPGEGHDAPQPGASGNDNLRERVMQALQPPIDFDFKDILELPPRIELRPYQWEGIKKLSENKSFLLGDDMGTGKTAQSILACRMLYQRGDVHRALFVAPRTVIPQWADEFGKWAPPLTVAVVQGDKKARQLMWGRQAHVWLTTYDILHRDIAVIKAKHSGFDLMVADEAQRIKNPQTKTARAARQLGALSTRKWALTGTPVENSKKDLESIFDFVKPGLFGPEAPKKPNLSQTPILDALREAGVHINRKTRIAYMLADNGVDDDLFVDVGGRDDLIGVLMNDEGRFGDMDLDDDGTIKQEALIDALIDEVQPGNAFKLKPRISHGEIIKPYFLRRRIEDVIEDLPHKMEIPLWLHLNDEQQATYNTMERDKVIRMQGREITAFHILTLINELKQICNRDPVSGRSVKIDWLQEKLEDAIESGGNKFLVFSQYRQERCGGRDYISAELAKFGTLNYGQGTKADDKVLWDFQNDPGKRVFIGHPKVAGVGLNQLTVADQVVHFDHWWNPAVTKQATARAYRFGQQSSTVIVYHLWVKNTVEEMVWEKTEAKMRLFDEVINQLSNTQINEIAFEVRDELLKKYGFAPVQPSSASYTPRGFEEEVCRVFGAMGYNTRLTPQSADGGVDVIATKEVGASLEKIAIQCKHQKAPIGRPVCQQLLGVVSGDTTYSRGILITTGTASRDAEEFVGKNGKLQIINGAEFESLRKKYISSD